jgi:hypothetical protein
VHRWPHTTMKDATPRRPWGNGVSRSDTGGRTGHRWDGYAHRSSWRHGEASWVVDDKERGIVGVSQEQKGAAYRIVSYRIAGSSCVHRRHKSLAAGTKVQCCARWARGLLSMNGCLEEAKQNK